jgi:hypothetical protein
MLYFITVLPDVKKNASVSTDIKPLMLTSSPSPSYNSFGNLSTHGFFAAYTASVFFVFTDKAA